MFSTFCKCAFYAPYCYWFPMLPIEDTLGKAVNVSQIVRKTVSVGQCDRINARDYKLVYLSASVAELWHLVLVYVTHLARYIKKILNNRKSCLDNLRSKVKHIPQMFYLIVLAYSFKWHFLYPYSPIEFNRQRIFQARGSSGAFHYLSLEVFAAFDCSNVISCPVCYLSITSNRSLTSTVRYESSRTYQAKFYATGSTNYNLGLHWRLRTCQVSSLVEYFRFIPTGKNWVEWKSVKKETKRSSKSSKVSNIKAAQL